MTSKSVVAHDIFLNALEISDLKIRRAYIDAECRNDQALRNEVESLLEHAGRLGDFLEAEQSPANEVAATLATTPSLESGTQIGPYKLREQIGEGGMGVVYVAEQTEPVKRKVALKIIKPGMASQDVVARFGAERQALAIMDHPNIARVFDGGVTESGQPFFVMELVQGIPVTEYCDEQRLSTTERLKLFTKVCRAIQHAHQRGVIHRDLKPSNIIVAEIDAEAVPKVIDFGVAKAVGHTLTEETVYTHFSQMVGTPLYMSPEQTGLGVVDIDTRSDVYSLGVLLYELLTGNTPFDRETLKSAGFDEMRRMIREDEPMCPSDLVSTLKADAISTVSERRHCDPRRLRDLLRGELDWLVMKALEKDRNRRYESASELANDVDRYLSGEPLKAGPPTFAYRFKKLAIRHQAAVATAGLVLSVLVLGVLGTTWQARRANQAREIATENFRRARDTVNTLLTKIDENPLLQDSELQPLRTELLEVARDYYQHFVEDAAEDLTLQEDLVEAHLRLGAIAWTLGEYEISHNAHQRAVAIRRRQVAADPRDPAQQRALVETLMTVAKLPHEGQVDNLRDAVAAAKPLKHTPHEYILATAYTELSEKLLGQYAQNTGDPSQRVEALQAAEEALEIVERLREGEPDNHAYQFGMIRILAQLNHYHRLAGDNQQAVEFQQQSLKLVDALSRAELQDATQREQLAAAYSAAGKYVQAMEIYRDLVSDHPTVIHYQEALVYHYRGAAMDQPEEEVSHLESAVVVARGLHDRFPESKQHSGMLGVAISALAKAQLNHGKPSDAIDLYQESISVLSKVKPYLIGHLSDGYGSLSDAQVAAGNLEGAIQATQQALQLSSEIRELMPNNLRFVTAGAELHRHLASFLRQTGKLDQALASVRAGISLLEAAFADGTPDAPLMNVLSARMTLRDCHLDMGRYLRNLGHHADAADAFRQAIATEANACRAAPNILVRRFPNEIYDLWLDAVVDDPKAHTQIESVLRDELLTWQELQESSRHAWSFQVREFEVQLRLAEWLRDNNRDSESAQAFSEANRILAAGIKDHQNGQWGKFVHSVSAAFHVCRPLKTTGTQHRARVEFIKLLLDHVVPALEIARREAEKHPGDSANWDSWSELALAHYRAREWRGADAEATAAIELAGHRLPMLQKMAPLLLLAGRDDSYRSLCDGLLESLDRRSGDALKQILELCLLDPQATLPERLLTAANRSASTTGETYLRHVAEYRAGELQKAIRGLEGIMKSDRAERAIVQMHLAIANHLIGRDDVAADWLEQAMGNHAEIWRSESRMQFEVLRAEAERRLSESSPTTN